MAGEIPNHDQRLEEWYRPENFERTADDVLAGFDVQEFPLMAMPSGNKLFAIGTNLRKDAPM